MDKTTKQSKAVTNLLRAMILVLGEKKSSAAAEVKPIPPLVHTVNSSSSVLSGQYYTLCVSLSIVGDGLHVRGSNLLTNTNGHQDSDTQRKRRQKDPRYTWIFCI